MSPTSQRSSPTPSQLAWSVWPAAVHLEELLLMVILCNAMQMPALADGEFKVAETIAVAYVSWEIRA